MWWSNASYFSWNVTCLLLNPQYLLKAKWKGGSFSFPWQKLWDPGDIHLSFLVPFKTLTGVFLLFSNWCIKEQKNMNEDFSQEYLFSWRTAHKSCKLIYYSKPMVNILELTSIFPEKRKKNIPYIWVSASFQTHKKGFNQNLLKNTSI